MLWSGKYTKGAKMEKSVSGNLHKTLIYDGRYTSISTSDIFQNYALFGNLFLSHFVAETVTDTVDVSMIVPTDVEIILDLNISSTVDSSFEIFYGSDISDGEEMFSIQSIVKEDYELPESKIFFEPNIIDIGSTLLQTLILKGHEKNITRRPIVLSTGVYTFNCQVSETGMIGFSFDWIEKRST